MSFDRFKVDKPTALMSRLDEIIKSEMSESAALRTLAAEVDELRGKLDALRAEADPQALVICHMQGRAEGDEVITKLLAMLKPGEQPKPEAYDGYDQLFRERLCRWNDSNKRYARACEISGRTE